MQYYVNAQAAGNGSGSKEDPFRTIQAAADAAKAGDIVCVLPGIYRESVSPRHAGTEGKPIVYVSEQPLQAVITGAEPLSGWQRDEAHPGVWINRVSNELFESFNPYTEVVRGDWYMGGAPGKPAAHRGDVFLNDKSMYETDELYGVYEPIRSKASWDPDFSIYTWFARQDEQHNETVFYANFQKLDPNREKVEISVRETCFYPEQEGISYITLRGFTVCKAATQWAPPTAYQIGMIGPHWSRNWIIEDCEIFESKCSGISLGKYLQPENDNKWLKQKYKDGTQTERDCICQAQREGWTKEKIGHHIIRRCNIHDCGQTGIVGHLGGVFSLIEENHIHHINNKQNLAGAEIGGIKMHAAIDVIYRRNHIHHCTRGIWLDWQAQGTRVTQNLFHDNTLPNAEKMEEPSLELFQGLGEDIFVEVSHGPTLIDNNILLSARALKAATQGVAMVHNLIGGSIAAVGIGTNNGSPNKPSPRYTPYHVPHRTEIAGFMTILHGDMRFYNNIFVQQQVPPVLRRLEQLMGSDGNGWDDGCMSVGTMRYDGYSTFEEWRKMFEGYCGMGAPDSDRYYSSLPVWSEGNVFLGGAKPWEKEKNFLEDSERHEVVLKLRDDDGRMMLETNIFDIISGLNASSYAPGRISTQTLGMAFEPEEYFENPDGTAIEFDQDYFGAVRKDPEVAAGPFAQDGKTFVL